MPTQNTTQTNKTKQMDTISRVHILATELDRLNIKNIAKKCHDRHMANDMSIILEHWLKCMEKLDTRGLLIKCGTFSSSMGLYTELIRVLGPFQLEGIMPLIEDYIDFYKNRMIL